MIAEFKPRNFLAVIHPEIKGFMTEFEIMRGCHISDNLNKFEPYILKQQEAMWKQELLNKLQVNLSVFGFNGDIAEEVMPVR